MAAALGDRVPSGGDQGGEMRDELRIVYQTSDPRSGRLHQHDARMAIRDSRAIMVRRRLDGQEPPVIAVFPLAAQGFRHCSSGIAHLQNWDGEHMVIPCLLAMSPLLDAEVRTID